MRKAIHIAVWFLFITFALSESQASSSTSQYFEQGVVLYKDGQYYEAIEKWENIIEQDQSSFETYYNLGNAYFRTNQMPEAVYYYEKALQLKPRHEDALHNIQFVRSLILKDVKNIPEAFHIRFADNAMKLFSPNGWAYTSILLFALTLTCIIFFLTHVGNKVKRLLFYFSLLGIFLTASSWYLGNRLHQSIKNPNHAIVMTASAGIKSSPDKTSADVYVAPAGMKVKIISKLGEWLEVRVPDGNKGWIQKESVRLI
jgi:tetratricopeptide (TPR) repeat protein